MVIMEPFRSPLDPFGPYSTPDLKLEWNPMTNRSGFNLKLPSIVNMTGAKKSLVESSIRSEGVKLFNCLPDSLKVWNGSFEIFKANLDKFLEGIPDNPRTETLRPDCSDYSGNSSNSIKDWVRKIGLNNFVFNSKILFTCT